MSENCINCINPSGIENLNDILLILYSTCYLIDTFHQQLQNPLWLCGKYDQSNCIYNIFWPSLQEPHRSTVNCRNTQKRLERRTLLKRDKVIYVPFLLILERL